MPKRIVFCADGAWEPSLTNSNTYKIYKSLMVSPDQMPLYDDGYTELSSIAPISNSPILPRRSTLTTRDETLPSYQIARRVIVKQIFSFAAGSSNRIGMGLFEKVKDAYTKIAHAYEKDDEIFIFGGSRGAYTARALSEMIALCGLPLRSFNNSFVEVVFQAYRDRSRRTTLLSSFGKNALYDSKIKMLGVWETVGALGIPSGLSGVDAIAYGLLETSLHPNILNAYEALAIDERRAAFPPTLWPSASVQGQVLKQVWFAGSHGDVNGGYPGGETGLSDIALSWMLNNAAIHGLDIAPNVSSHFNSLTTSAAVSVKHESWTASWGFPLLRHIPRGSLIADSVRIRLTKMSEYRPQNLKLNSSGQPNGYVVESVITKA